MWCAKDTTVSLKNLQIRVSTALWKYLKRQGMNLFKLISDFKEVHLCELNQAKSGWICEESGTKISCMYCSIILRENFKLITIQLMENLIRKIKRIILSLLMSSDDGFVLQIFFSYWNKIFVYFNLSKLKF